METEGSLALMRSSLLFLERAVESQFELLYNRGVF